MVRDECPPAAVERDGANVVGLVRERHAGRVQLLEVVLTMPLGLAKRKRYNCDLTDGFMISYVLP